MVTLISPGFAEIPCNFLELQSATRHADSVAARTVDGSSPVATKVGLIWPKCSWLPLKAALSRIGAPVLAPHPSPEDRPAGFWLHPGPDHLPCDGRKSSRCEAFPWFQVVVGDLQRDPECINSAGLLSDRPRRGRQIADANLTGRRWRGLCGSAQ